ncbi:hypothetical protein SeMB42_g06952 [Synchytrium endobioticum]|uniref:DNA-PKcs N-terminal domain-containing protein n=1 Tax=Synchytrium endobioticum TaxID=286115 RepID=A0A507CGW8_9FUNG|nr:hypothetical protein SeMB42_g06952 [Synchytrium endobioticum]TPX40496.1 hypothetical protein SeLEV6574_g06596 [Synchytrium endobioticum]
MEHIRECMRALMDIVNEANDEKVGYALSYLENVEAIISNLQTSDLILTRSIVLDRQAGVTAFTLKAAGKGKFLADECVKALALLKNYIYKLGNDIGPFSDHVQGTAVGLLDYDPASAKIKQGAAEVLMAIVDVSKPLSRERPMINLFETLTYTLQTLKAASPATVTSAVIEVMGLIIGRFPHLIAEAAAKAFATSILARTRDGKHKNFIAQGVLSAFKYLLYAYPDYDTPGDKKRLWDLTKQALEATDEKRMGYARAGLNIIGAHAKSFASFISPNFHGIFDAIVKWARHPNSETQNSASYALEGFIDFAARELSNQEHDGAERKTKTIFLIKRFERILSENPLGDNSTKHAVEKLQSKALEAFGKLFATAQSFDSATATSYRALVWESYQKYVATLLQ